MEEQNAGDSEQDMTEENKQLAASMLGEFVTALSVVMPAIVPMHDAVVALTIEDHDPTEQLELFKEAMAGIGKTHGVLTGGQFTVLCLMAGHTDFAMKVTDPEIRRGAWAVLCDLVATIPVQLVPKEQEPDTE